MNYNSSSLAVKTKYTPTRKIAKRPVEHTVTKSKVIVFLFASLIILISVLSVIYFKTQIYSNKVEIAELTQQLEKIKVENDSDELAMKSSIDIQKIYDVATGKLGMKKLTNDQIIHYNTENSDYIHQTGELTK